jgi:hypothetical protein
MDDYIAKPIDPKALAATIARWLEAGDRAPAPEHVEPTAEEDPALHVLDGHLAQTGRDLLALRAAISYHDEDELRRLCAQLRGRTTEIGAWRMSELVGSLADQSITECYPTFAELEREFEQLRNDLTAAPAEV